MRLFSSGKRERDKGGRPARQTVREVWWQLVGRDFLRWTPEICSYCFSLLDSVYLFILVLPFFSSNQGSVFTSFFLGRCRSTASISLLKRPAKLAIVCKVSVAAARHLSPSLNSSSSLFITRTPLRFAFIAAGPPYVRSCERDSGAKQKRGDLRNMSPNWNWKQSAAGAGRTVTSLAPSH